MKSKRFNLAKLVQMAMLSAISYVLMITVHFPMITSYLKYDPADVPLVLGAMLWGPVESLFMAVVVCVLKGLLFSTSGPFGVLMNVLSSAAFCMTAGALYRLRRTNAGAVVGLLAGTAAMCAVMIPSNILVTPLYTGQTIKGVIDILLPVIIPFNLIKAGINSALTLVIYIPFMKYVMPRIKA